MCLRFALPLFFFLVGETVAAPAPESVVPPPGRIASVWGQVSPANASLLAKLLADHRAVTGEPVFFRVGPHRVDGEDSKGDPGVAMQSALEGARLGGGRRNGVLLWLSLAPRVRGGVAAGFAVDAVWPPEDRDHWVDRRVLPLARAGRIDEAVGTLIWGALLGLESPVIQRPGLKAELERKGALFLEELPEEGGRDRGLGISFAATLIILLLALPLVAWVLLVAAGGEREWRDGRWVRVPLPTDLADRIRAALTRAGVKRGASSPGAGRAGEAWVIRRTQSLWDRDLDARARMLQASIEGAPAVLLVSPLRGTLGFAPEASEAPGATVQWRERLSGLLRETQFENALGAAQVPGFRVGRP
jgi:hypothetical protein